MTAQHLAVLGPTCCWKSETALLVAECRHAEIINCDSMQVYRGLDIGTAKPTLRERLRVPHHLMDCIDLGTPCNASAYVTMAETVLKGLEERGVGAVLVGGTGLYARSLIYGSYLLPADRALFAALQAALNLPGGQTALRRELLAHCDPADIPDDVVRNPRRLLRAIEVLRLTGSTPWEIHRRQPTQGPGHDFRQFVLLPRLELLRSRIIKRTAEMLRAGWIEEARDLIQNGLLTAPTARHALGYRDVGDFLDGRISTLADLEETLVRRTIAYARRQLTWFRHQHPGAVRVELLRETSAEELALLLLQQADLPTVENRVLRLV